MIIITQASTNDTLCSAVCFILMHFARARAQAATSSLVHFFIYGMSLCINLL